MRSGDLVGIVALLLVSSLQTAGSNGSTSSDTFCSSLVAEHDSELRSQHTWDFGGSCD